MFGVRIHLIQIHKTEGLHQINIGPFTHLICVMTQISYSLMRGNIRPYQIRVPFIPSDNILTKMNRVYQCSVSRQKRKCDVSEEVCHLLHLKEHHDLSESHLSRIENAYTEIFGSQDFDVMQNFLVSLNVPHIQIFVNTESYSISVSDDADVISTTAHHHEHPLLLVDVIVGPSLHCNVLVIDRMRRTIERYEPQFITSQLNDTIDSLLAEYYYEQLPSFRYIPNDNIKQYAIQALTWPNNLCIEFCMLYIIRRVRDGMTHLQARKDLIKNICSLNHEVASLYDHLSELTDHHSI